MRILVLASLLCIGSVSFLAGEQIQGLESVLPGSVASTLIKDGRILRTVYRESPLHTALAPALSPSSEISKSIDPNDNLLIESLFLYKKKDSNLSGNIEKSVEKTGIILRSLSTLEGIEYFSTSRDAMRVLYENSYAVDSAANRNRIVDPISADIDGQQILAVQKDKTFGEYLYKYSYRATPTAVSLTSTNVDPLKISFVTVVGPERMKVSLVVHDLGDYLLVYGCTHVKVPEIPGLEKKLNSSFSTRSIALYDWFINAYEN